MEFESKHLDFLKNTIDEEYNWKGRNPAIWASSFWNGEELNLIDRIYTKEDLLDSRVTDELDDILLSISILSWGNMTIKNGRRLFADPSIWVNAVAMLRNNQFSSRKEAYNHFYHLDNSGRLPGMRPAFYTKLIFFLDRSLNGYIMDQWTAKSVNLLLGEDLIKLDYSGFVDSSNDLEIYDKYCEIIESLAKKLEIRPTRLEEILFSEGRGKGTWRNYINDTFPHKKKRKSLSKNSIDFEFTNKILQEASKDISPLSRRGKTITYYKDSNKNFHVKWGNFQFIIEHFLIVEILQKFFIDYNCWYPLAANIDKPNPNGLGNFINVYSNNRFSPRAASAIAAILVNEEVLTFKGSGKRNDPILLSEIRKDSFKEFS